MTYDEEELAWASWLLTCYGISEGYGNEIYKVLFWKKFVKHVKLSEKVLKWMLLNMSDTDFNVWSSMEVFK